MTLPIPITYRFERADCWRLGAMLFRPSWKARFWRAVLMAACLLGGLLLGLGHWPTSREWGWLMRSPQLVGLVVTLLVLSQVSHYCNILTLWARFRTLAIADKPITLAFDQDGLDTDVGGTRSSVPWANFIARTEEDDRVFLKIGKWEALTIPRRAFPDDASWQQVLAFLREKVPNGSL